MLAKVNALLACSQRPFEHGEVVGGADEGNGKDEGAGKGGSEDEGEDRAGDGGARARVTMTVNIRTRVGWR